MPWKGNKRKGNTKHAKVPPQTNQLSKHPIIQQNERLAKQERRADEKNAQMLKSFSDCRL